MCSCTTLPSSARTTTTNYGTRCQLPESVTNALGQTATISYRYDIGDVVRVAVPAAACHLFDRSTGTRLLA